MTEQWRPQPPGRPSAPPPAGAGVPPVPPSVPPPGQTATGPVGQPHHAAGGPGGYGAWQAPKPGYPTSQTTPPRAPHPVAQVHDGGAFGDRFVVPEEAPEQKRRRTPTPEERRKLVVPLVIGLGLLLAAGGTAWYLLFGRPVVDPATKVSTGPATGVQVRKADEVVRSYLNAVAGGRATEALGYGPQGKGSRVLLTDDALRAALQRAPLTDIVVSPAEDTATAVAARYRLGGEPVSTQIKVQRQPDGTWRLATTTVTVTISGNRTKGVPLLVNGVAVDDPQVEVLPGYYALGTGMPFLAYDQSTDVVVRTLDHKADIGRLALVITPEGLDAMQRVGRASLERCLASRELDPAGCPIGGTLAGSVDPGSVTWTQQQDPWSAFAPQLPPGESVAKAPMTIKTTVSFTLDGGRASTQDVSQDARLDMDLAVAQESELTPVWKRQ